MAGSGCTDNALAMSNDGVATSHRIAPEKELLSSLEVIVSQRFFLTLLVRRTHDITVGAFRSTGYLLWVPHA